MNQLLTWLFKLPAHFPLILLHQFGCALGWISYLFSSHYAKRLQDNLSEALTHSVSNISNRDIAQIKRANIAEAGKSIMELPWIWQRPLTEVVAAVKYSDGWEQVEASRAAGKGIILLTPHFGCFELIALYAAAKFPMTSMYKSPRWQWIDHLMHQGRERGQMKLATADSAGVRQLFKALKRGEVIGILPDQVPSQGDGEWSNFFGRPAYTMTLIGRLAHASGAAVILCQMQRLPKGAGYHLRCETLHLDFNASVAEQINRAMETVILNHPEQYLWSYNRYKTPRGVSAPTENNTKES